MKKFLITGGAGFIGSNFIHLLFETGEDHQVLNLDKLTYAGNPDNLKTLAGNPAYHFKKADICNSASIGQTLREFNPDYILNFAAETHVDRSIDGPGKFIETNITGTYHLLKNAWQYFQSLDSKKKEEFRFLHISTDEVFGELGPTGKFTEKTPYDPSSPYSASKASSDHLVRAWFKTFGLPVLITNCSNNYGPYQFPEKLIPLMIINAISRESLPVYGKGENIRDWIYVEDHCRGIKQVLEKGTLGETYNIGGDSEKTNIEVVESICQILDEIHPQASEKSYRDQISFVEDRPGHDFRYAIDHSKIRSELGWEPLESFKTGLKKTVEWYVNNRPWWEKLQGKYKQERLGKA